MKIMLLSNVNIKWISFKPKNFHVKFKVMFPSWYYRASYYHGTVGYKILGKIFEEIYFVDIYG